MSDPSEPAELLRARLDHNLRNFLRTDLSLCFTFADLAATMFIAGNPVSAQQAMADAEKGYQTLSRFLSDPKHIRHLTGDEIQEFRAELQRLRERLDGLQQ
jgi:hypothetical protein